MSTGPKARSKGGTREQRKEARPAEIVEAAFECFLENGFAATNLDQVARRAGVAKGTLYLYFESKEQLFRAVVQQATSTNLKNIGAAAGDFEGPFEQLVPILLSQIVNTVAASRAPAIARLIMREVDRIPDLARIWFEDVASPMLSALEALAVRAQSRGEITVGDPRVQVFSVLGPITMGILFTSVLARLDQPGVDLQRLAEQHAETVLYGLSRQPRPTTRSRTKAAKAK